MNRYMFGADRIESRECERIVCRAKGDKLHYMLVNVDKSTGGYKIVGEYITKESVEFRLNNQHDKEQTKKGER